MNVATILVSANVRRPTSTNTVQPMPNLGGTTKENHPTFAELKSIERVLREVLFRVSIELKFT